jgi:hypothetical protein
MAIPSVLAQSLFAMLMGSSFAKTVDLICAHKAVRQIFAASMLRRMKSVKVVLETLVPLA